MAKRMWTVPSGRDFEAYELVKVQEKSTRQAARELGISQTRVCQIVENVGQYVLRMTPPCLTPEDVGRQCNLAKQLAAAQVQFMVGTAMRDYEDSKGKPVIREVDTEGRPRTTITTTKPGVGDVKLLDRAVKFAMLSAKLPVPTLSSLFTGEDVAAEEEEIVAAEIADAPSGMGCSPEDDEQEEDDYEDEEGDDESDDDDDTSDYLTDEEAEEFRQSILAHEAVQRERERQLLGLSPGLNSGSNSAVQAATTSRVLPR